MNTTMSELHDSHPVLDFRLFSKDQPEEVRRRGLQILDDAFRTHGFVYLSHHGVPESLVNATFDWMKRFFDLPSEIKFTIRRSSNPLEPRGYTSIGDAVLDQDTTPHNLKELANARSTAPVEQRETVELGSPYTVSQQQNRLLPEAVFPGFADWLETWWGACTSLQQSLMKSFDEILSNESGMSGVLGKQQDLGEDYSNMSLIHYHSVSRSDITTKKTSRCNAHTDSGQLTLLFQDNVGGLEVYDGNSSTGQAQFIPVPPKPGAVIVQLGDMLEKQSNGRWRSALHRVTAPTVEATDQQNSNESEATPVVETLQDRYSAAFFVYPQLDTKIEPLPGCIAEGPWNSLDWGNVQTAGEWWHKRLQLEFGGAQSQLVRV